MIFKTYNNYCNSEFLENKRREPNFLDLENQKFHTIFKHLKTYSVLCRIVSKLIPASTRAVFERDIIVFLAKVISEGSGLLQVDPIH